MKKTLQTFPKCHNFKQKKHSVCANQVANWQTNLPISKSRCTFWQNFTHRPKCATRTAHANKTALAAQTARSN